MEDIILFGYLIFHTPAFIMLSLGLRDLKNEKIVRGKKYFIYAGIYFLIGGGICGAFLI